MEVAGGEGKERERGRNSLLLTLRLWRQQLQLWLHLFPLSHLLSPVSVHIIIDFCKKFSNIFFLL